MVPFALEFTFARGLALDRQLVRSALQKIKDWPRRHRQAASTTGRAAGVALKANARSEFAQDRSGVFGNDRARPSRLDEGRRNHFPSRDGRARSRSEEHTSELQSHLNLVCRLLLEKKKVYHQSSHASAPRPFIHPLTS